VFLKYAEVNRCYTLGLLSLLPSVGWEMGSSLRASYGKDLVWLIEAMSCLLAANHRSNYCSL